VEVPYPPHPLGARGVGEMPIVPPAAAIGAAVDNALGVRMNRLPMSQDAILEAVKNGG
jgi:CO/xanthine dehydrogenase Mo-binding subunit